MRHRSCVLLAGVVLAGSLWWPMPAAGSDPIPFTVFPMDIGDRGSGETRKVFFTAAAFQQYFGRPAPGVVDFAKDWVVFYSAGSKQSDGYLASIQRLTTSEGGMTLKIFAALSSPGPDCLVKKGFTTPHVLAKFRWPTPKPTYEAFYRDDTVRPCVRPPAGRGTGALPGVSGTGALPGGKGVKCGTKTCPTGQVCCNASCGICTPPNGACPQLVCN